MFIIAKPNHFLHDICTFLSGNSKLNTITENKSLFQRQNAAISHTCAIFYEKPLVIVPGKLFISMKSIEKSTMLAGGLQEFLVMLLFLGRGCGSCHPTHVQRTSNYEAPLLDFAIIFRISFNFRVNGVLLIPGRHGNHPSSHVAGQCDHAELDGLLANATGIDCRRIMLMITSQ